MRKSYHVGGMFARLLGDRSRVLRIPNIAPVASIMTDLNGQLIDLD